MPSAGSPVFFMGLYRLLNRLLDRFTLTGGLQQKRTAARIGVTSLTSDRSAPNGVQLLQGSGFSEPGARCHQCRALRRGACRAAPWCLRGPLEPRALAKAAPQTGCAVRPPLSRSSAPVGVVVPANARALAPRHQGGELRQQTTRLPKGGLHSVLHLFSGPDLLKCGQHACRGSSSACL